MCVSEPFFCLSMDTFQHFVTTVVTMFNPLMTLGADLSERTCVLSQLAVTMLYRKNIMRGALQSAPRDYWAPCKASNSAAGRVARRPAAFFVLYKFAISLDALQGGNTAARSPICLIVASLVLQELVNAHEWH